MELKDHIWNLVAKKLAGEASEDELKELSDLLKNNPAVASVVSKLEDWWLSSRDTERDNSILLFNRIRNKINSNQQKTVPFHWQSTGGYSQINSSMIKNYLKVAWRNLANNKAFSFINISGLAVGMALAMLIGLWIWDEYSVDGFHKNGKELYQVYERQTHDGIAEAGYFTQGPLAEELKKQVPEVLYASGLEQSHPITFEADNKVLKMDGSYAGADFFQMFTYKLLEGRPENALSKPGSLAISRKMAEAFYGSPADAIGKTIRYENKDNLTITAVFENLPVNSSQQFDFLKGWKDFITENAWAATWGSSSPYTFVQLRADADPLVVGAKIKAFIKQFKVGDAGAQPELLLQPYTEKYLHSLFKNGQLDGGRITYVQLFTIVAIAILLIACVNFMNLATARSVKRAKEVGVRKVIGAARASLVKQFLSEALLVTFIGVLLSLVIVIALLPTFNGISGKQISLPYNQPLFWLALVGLVTITGTVAGSYPALFLSALNPVRTLKAGYKIKPSAAYFRKALVIFQFTMSLILIVGAVVVSRQMEFVQSKNLGYDRENLVYIPLEGELIKKYELFKDEAGSLPGIQAITKMKESPTVIGHTKGDISWPGKAPGNSPFSDAMVDYDFVKTMKLELLDGRDFSKQFADSANYLINEAAAKKIGYSKPVGQPLAMGNRAGKIIGLLKDFHFNSMHQSIEPLVIRLADNQKWGTILLRIKAGDTKKVLTSLELICKELNPDFTFSYQFSDEEYAKLYKSEQVVNKLSNYFAVIAIFISCLGLLGLAIFTAEQRTREIGIRKILGAGVQSLFTLMLSDFLLPVVIALFLAAPIAWYFMSGWLQDFVYHTTIEWWMFALSGGLMIFIAAVTVSFQSIKAALVNPVKSLRSE
jgi:putative ABC transport system permease protein